MGKCLHACIVRIEVIERGAFEMKTKPPCKVNGVDCPRRYVGCRAGCEKWHEWLVVHERETARRRQYRHNEADGFLVGRKKRVEQARHRDYMRERK